MKNFGIKIKNFCITNWKILIFLLFFLIINCAFLAITCEFNGIAVRSKRFLLIIAITIPISIAACAFIIYTKQKNWAIEKIFLVIGSVLGVMYLFAIPMGRTPDEPAHIWRVYGIAQGDILPATQDGVNGALLPQNVANFGNGYIENAYAELAELLPEPASDEIVFRSTVSSHPINYLPQVIGIFIGRILHLPMLVTLYLARICGLAVCIAIIYFCLKYIPILKKPLFFISCLPLSMQTFIAVSYDGAIFCAATALITFVLYTVYNKNFKFKTSHYFLISLLSIALVTIKPVYLPICLLLFFIPSRCFKNKKQKVFAILVAAIAAIGVFVLWSLLSMSSYTVPGNGADTGGQISFILSHPAKFAAVLIHNILDMPFVYLQRLSTLEWLYVHTNDFYTIGTLVFFVILCTKEHFGLEKTKVSGALKWTALFAVVTTTILTFTALYIQWTEVGNLTIEGVQTRYLLPAMLLVPLACLPTKSVKSAPPQELHSLYLYGFIIFENICAIVTVVVTHI